MSVEYRRFQPFSVYRLKKIEEPEKTIKKAAKYLITYMLCFSRHISLRDNFIDPFVNIKMSIIARMRFLSLDTNFSHFAARIQGN